jgi:hypothetical protein
MDTEQAIQNKFEFDRYYKVLPWTVRRGSRAELAKLFGELGFNEGVEIGTCRGHFAEQLCKANPNIHLTCIDPWAENRNNSQDKQDHLMELTLQRIKPYNVTVVREFSPQALVRFKDGSLDFGYIDGDHLFDGVISDILGLIPKIRVGGIVALHDYHSEVGSDVMTAINAYTHCHCIYPWYVTREQWPTAFWVNR